MSAESESADVFDFVDAYLQELEQGNTKPLAWWLERFPRSQAAVAREWLVLTAPPQVAGPDTDTGAPVIQDDGVLRLGPYRVLRELGRGGQGTVYLAEDSRIARRVALKVLSSSFESISDEKRQRFRREADVIAKLEHPGLCTIHDADLAAAAPWIAMRFVEGRTLAECLYAARDAGGASTFGLRFPPRNTLEVHAVLLLFERAARALHAAHEAGIVHRDVKPGNVIIALDGRPILLDFGLARDDDSVAGTVTQSGDVFGTPAYMSPEQLSLSFGSLDRRTDVYSLGVALFEALTSTRPFDHAVRTVLYRQILEDPVPDARKHNRALSADVQVVLETALEKDRARRYATALELAEDLRRIREYEPIHARPATVSVRFARWTRRHPALAVATIGTILSLSIGLLVTLKLLANERRALEFAVGRHLAQRAEALAREDPPVALALGIEAVERAPNDLTRSSLFTALDACWLARAIEPPKVEKVQVRSIATSRASDLGAAGFSDGTIYVIALQEGVRERELDGHSAGIVSLEFDPAGERILSTAEDGSTLLHDARTGAIDHAFEADPPAARASFGPDGSALLIQRRSGRVEVHDATTFERVSTIEPRSHTHASASLSPSGDLVLIHVPGQTPTLFDARTGLPARELGDDAAIAVCAFVPGNTGARVVLAGTDGSVRAVQASSGRALGTSVRIDGIPTALVPCSDGVRVIVLANIEEEGWAWWCDLEAGLVRRIEEHDGHYVTQAAFSPDGRRFATTSFDTRIRTFDTESGRALRAFRVPLRLHDVHWSSDGNRLLTRSRTASAQVWYARARPDMFELTGHDAAVRTACFSPDGQTALTGSVDGTARLWRTPLRDDGRESGRAIAVMQHESPVLHASFSRTGDVLLTIAEGGDVSTFAADTGASLRPPAAHAGRVLEAVVDSPGVRFVTVCADGVARLWRVREAGDPLVLAMPGKAAAAAFSDDGQVVVVADDRGTIRVHDPVDGRPTREMRMSGSPESPIGVVALAFRPGSMEIAAAGSDKYLRFFDVLDGVSTRCFLDGGKMRDGLFAMQVKSLCFSDNGARVLVTSRFGGAAARSITLETGSGRKRGSPETASSTIPQQRHSQDLTGACYDAKGSVVLTTSKDGSAYVWDASDGTPVVSRDGFPSAVLCCALSSAGGTLRAITGCADGSVCVWPVDPQPAARARLPRPLASWEKERERQLALPLELEFD